MANLPGFFLESAAKFPRAQADIWQLDISERDAWSHLKALRLKTGDHLWLLNGRGQRAELQVRDVKKGIFVVQNLMQLTRPTPHLDVYLSPPKGDDLDRAVQICVELGVRRLHLFKSEHSSHVAALKVGRLQRIAQASAEQSLNPWQLQIENAFEQELSETFSVAEGDLLAFDEALAGDAPFFNPAANEKTKSLFFGPEGGWSARERKLFADHHVSRAALGSIVLKVPTAIAVALGVIRSKS